MPLLVRSRLGRLYFNVSKPCHDVPGWRDSRYALLLDDLHRLSGSDTGLETRLFGLYRLGDDLPCALTQQLTERIVKAFLSTLVF